MTERDSLYACKCGACDHESKSLCIEGQCDCCDLEDTFAILSQHEFEPRHLRYHPAELAA